MTTVLRLAPRPVAVGSLRIPPHGLYPWGSMMGKRGLALAMVIMAALLASIAAYAMLLAATSQATQGRLTIDHARARYAAEAALVWAQQQLLADRTWNSGQGAAHVTIDGIGVDITTTPCVPSGGDPSDPCPNTRELTARVVYR